MRAVGKVLACFGFVFFACFATVLNAGAQVDPDPASTTVVVTICLEDGCNQRENVPGAIVTAYDFDSDEVVGSCETDANGSCAVSTPDGPGSVEIEVDSGLDPAQYAPKDGWTPYAEDGVLFFGYEEIVAAQPETKEIFATTMVCDVADCANGAGPAGGSVVTSFTADGTELDSCTTSPSDEGALCELAVPANDDGTYQVTAPAGYENYVLRNADPETVNEAGTVYGWTFVPAEEPQGGFPANVVACSDASCDDAVTMDGAELVSYQDGVEVDRCIVESGADDFDGCVLFIGADKVDVQITPAEGYEDYVLLSEQPEVYESEEHGRIYLWTYVLADDDATVTPEPTEAVSATTTPVVTSLPETGAGDDAGSQATPSDDLLILGLGSLALLGLAAVASATRLHRR